MHRYLYRNIYNLALRNHIEKPHEKLVKLFQCQQTKIELSQHLKILPDYLSKSFVEQFCQSKTYLSYCQNGLQRQCGNEQISLQFKSDRLLRAIKYQQATCLQAFLHWLINQCSSFDMHENNYAVELLNLSNPEKWFQNIDSSQKRLFIYHHGPTNSGKSTSAVQQLKRLPKNERGIYMAPLRLLAWQYQQKLGNCSLITGQEKQYKNSNLVSCTIQAAPLNDQYEVAVIDEIQMIVDEERGWAWTRAVLATKAKRIHLCGDERALNIITKILEKTGDSLEERRYSRLSKLTLIHKKFKLSDISEGDCIINFSMNALINHRNDINRQLGQTKKQHIAKEVEQQIQSNPQTIDQVKEKVQIKVKNHAAIIYGKLPPQCRKSQAISFNTGKLPYLVATNAIGMGLNLNIKKIIFLSVERPTNNGSQLLQEHQIQQIAGRAGRGKQTGYVQCANGFVLKRVEKALEKVNQTYGIQLQNLKDGESNESDHSADEEKQEQKSSQSYNPFLKRFMRQKQCQVKAACFYFQTDFIITFKMHLQLLMKRAFSTTQILNYLKRYSIIGNLYFFQQKKSLEYLMNLVQNKIGDQQQLFYFYNGLGLSLPNYSTSRSIRQRLQRCHQEYVENFVNLRKVPLPTFIVQLYNEHFVGYRFMDQVNQLQLYFNLIQTYVWLWGKFQFAFYQIKLAKLIKQVLASKINQILENNQFLTKINHINSFKIYQRSRPPKLKLDAKPSPVSNQQPIQAKQPVQIKVMKQPNQKAFFKNKRLVKDIVSIQSSKIKNRGVNQEQISINLLKT